MNHREFVRTLLDDQGLRAAIDRYMVNHPAYSFTHKGVMEDYVNGRQVQYSRNGETWEDAGEPRFIKSMEYRKKPKTKKINGFTVPSPEEKEPHGGQEYYFPVLDYADLYCRDSWKGCSKSIRVLERGMVYLSEESAVAAAKAMLGIDPEWESDQ